MVPTSIQSGKLSHFHSDPKRGTDMDFYGTSLQQYYTTKHVCCNLSGEPVILTT